MWEEPNTPMLQHSVGLVVGILFRVIKNSYFTFIHLYPPLSTFIHLYPPLLTYCGLPDRSDRSDRTDLGGWQLRNFAVLGSVVMSKHGKIARLGLIGLGDATVEWWSDGVMGG
jgi:hypothetical protein